jgi:hypothetical protein
MKIKNLNLEKVQFFIIVFMFVMIIGMAFNFLAMINNGGKMPVYTENFIPDSEHHFTYQYKGEVEYWFLTDIIKIFNCKVSIGDVLLISSASVITYLIILSALIKERRIKLKGGYKLKWITKKN